MDEITYLVIVVQKYFKKWVESLFAKMHKHGYCWYLKVTKSTKDFLNLDNKQINNKMVIYNSYKTQAIVENNSNTALLTTFNKEMTRIMGKYSTDLIKLRKGTTYKYYYTIMYK